MKKGLLFTAALLAMFSACKEDEHEHAPEITITSPNENEYHVGDTVSVNVTITDEHELHEAECWFITRPQNDTLWSLYRHSHGNTITFNSFYVIDNLPDEQQVDFEVVAENEEGLVTTAKHSFEVHDH